MTARKGRPRKPTRQLERSGAFDKDPQRRRQGEPAADSHEPEMPEGLNDLGQMAWRNICSRIRTMGLLSKSDSEMLEMYARAYQDWRKCQKLTDSEGIVKGNRRNPADTAKAVYFGQMMNILGRFGLSPSDRSNLDITKATDPEENPFVKLAKIGGGKAG